MSYYLLHFEEHERYILHVHKDAYSAAKHLVQLRAARVFNSITYGCEEIRGAS